MPVKPKKIAIIGGGVGAITAAYAITQIPNWNKKYEITIYQLGWRLGGKGASGRNARQGKRIEEHGLHIWAGFYDNAFRLMRDCYETLNSNGLRKRDAPLGTFDRAFLGLNHFLIADEVSRTDGSKELQPWYFEFPSNTEKRGSGGVLPSPFAYLRMLLKAIARIMPDGATTAQHTLPARFHPHFKARNLAITADTPVHHLKAYVEDLPENAFDHGKHETLCLGDLARHAQDWHTQVIAQPSNLTNDDHRRIHYMVNLSLAFIQGAVDNDVFRAGFDAIDDKEISDWLLFYKASRDAVYSAVFRGCYDYVFGYPGGMTDYRSVGAGTAIRGLLRLAFTYKESLFFKMQAGMGDTIFAPYYQVLKERGVKFRFFNAATNMVVSPSDNSIAAIDMVEQAVPLAEEYDPLIDVKGLPCWPSEPKWDELKNGGELEKSGIDFESEKDAPSGRPYRLEKGRDFDLVVLGASIGSLKYMANELVQTSDRWRAMLDHVPTVATHAAQFWVNKTADQLGWNELVDKYNSKVDRELKTVITSFAEPLDTWADMTDLLPREDWPEDKPASVAYFCSPAHDEDEVPFTEQVERWADHELTRMWPGAAKDGKFDRSLLYAPNAGSEEEKFAAQYFRRNLYGSERYVLSVPGSVQYRLPPDESGFDNLYLAGDWTRCGINAGCVEAATISGLMAARGLTGHDYEIVGEGDLAPDAGPSDATRLASPYAQSAPWPLTPFYGTGKIDGWFSFHAVDAEALQAILPAGMHLAPQNLTPAGKHPVAILANHQMGVRASVLPGFLGYRNYYEAIIAINFVQLDGHDGVFSYLPNLYLDNRWAQLAGVWWYGYNKRMGQLEMGNGDYKVSSQNGRPIWYGQYQQRNVPRPLMDSPDCGLVQSISEQVVVSRSKFGAWRFSSFDFNLTSAYVAGVSARISVRDPRLAGLPEGNMHVGPLTMQGQRGHSVNRLPGAFRIWTSWTLSNPLDSNRIMQLEARRRNLP